MRSKVYTTFCSTTWLVISTLDQTPLFTVHMTRIRESAFINILEMQQTINSQAPEYQIFRLKNFLLEEIHIEHMKHINILIYF